MPFTFQMVILAGCGGSCGCGREQVGAEVPGQAHGASCSQHCGRISSARAVTWMFCCSNLCGSEWSHPCGWRVEQAALSWTNQQHSSAGLWGSSVPAPCCSVGCWAARFPPTPFPPCPRYCRGYWEPLRLLSPTWGWICQGLIPPLTAPISAEMISTPVVMGCPWLGGVMGPGKGWIRNDHLELSTALPVTINPCSSLPESLFPLQGPCWRQ